VVLGLTLDLVDPRDVEGDVARLGPDRLGGFLGDDAELRLRIRRMRLDLEPDLEAGLRLPDGGHFRAGVAGDHQTAPAKLFFTPRFSRAAETRQTKPDKRQRRTVERGWPRRGGAAGPQWRRAGLDHGTLNDRY